ncbi:hypothetical protein L596_024227 [Steinernema carpocapsae]|uniref:Uncharacterized protein n=1 Tax=Steinernema carpocapsae TaxID=34508 RepID=A0A4U5MG45_STECR|nr:hypothetical protein L596_024227 [Steinernema carpocapsae]
MSLVNHLRKPFLAFLSNGFKFQSRLLQVKVVCFSCQSKIENFLVILGEAVVTVKMLVRRGSQQNSYLGPQSKRISVLRQDRPLHARYSSPTLLESLRQQKAKVDRNWSFRTENEEMLSSQCASRSNVIHTSSASELAKPHNGAPPSVFVNQRFFDPRRDSGLRATEMKHFRDVKSAAVNKSHGEHSFVRQKRSSDPGPMAGWEFPKEASKTFECHGTICVGQH